MEPVLKRAQMDDLYHFASRWVALVHVRFLQQLRSSLSHFLLLFVHLQSGFYIVTAGEKKPKPNIMLLFCPNCLTLSFCVRKSYIDTQGFLASLTSSPLFTLCWLNDCIVLASLPCQVQRRHSSARLLAPTFPSDICLAHFCRPSQFMVWKKLTSLK